jgi:hypothetical protein
MMTPLSGIITGGLGRPACAGMIINFFRLSCGITVIPPEGGSSGGSIPLAPGDIHNFYQPVQNLPPYYIIPQDQQWQYGKKVQVVVTVKLGEKTIEKIYLVSQDKAKLIVKVANVANNTMERIKVIVNNLKRKIHDVHIFVSKLRKR